MKNIRSQFPILKTQVGGKKLVYFDNAATSQKPKQVIQEIVKYYESENSNVHRSLNPLAERATELYENSRKKIADFLGAQSPDEIIFTRNATEGINLVAKSWCKKNLRAGDVILLTELEHHSNIIPFLQLNQDTGVHVRFLPITEDGGIDLQEAKKEFEGKRVKFFSFSLASNVLGTIQRAKELMSLAAEKKVPVLLDAAQFAPHYPLNVQDFGCDFLVFSGHKVYGPTGIGVLFAKQEHLEAMPPFLGGGEMVNVVTKSGFTPKDPPLKFEAGTPHIAGAIGLSAAIEFIKSIGWKEILEEEKRLAYSLFEKLHSLSFVNVFGTRALENHLPIAAFTIPGIHPHDVADILGEEGICIRAGHHCAMPLHKALGVNATARASLSFYNTTEEIDMFIELLKAIHKKFQ